MPVDAEAPGAEVWPDHVTLVRFADAVILPLLSTTHELERVGVVGVPTASWNEEIITEFVL